MTYVSTILTLVGINLALSALANPITPNDVKQERALINPANCMVKVNIQSLFASSMPELTAYALTTGIADIDNKLVEPQNSRTIQPLPVEFSQISKPTSQPRAYFKHASYTCHSPSNSLPNFLATTTALPQIPQNAHKFNLLEVKAIIQVPTCLTFKELEAYIRLRFDKNLGLGAYWKELHRTRITPEDLALLRWFDYLDENNPKQPVTVYTCTEYQLR